MKTSVFITNSPIGLGHGGGVVCYNIVQALKSVTDLRVVLSEKNINPKRYHQPENPFLYDYFASALLNEEADIIQIYGAPFGQTVKKFPSAKVIVDIAPHNIDLSREEHERLGLPFNYPHLNDMNLWRNRYMLHVRLADVVIVHSAMSAHYIKEKLDLDNDILVIPHGTEIPKEVSPPPETFTVAHVGVNGADKGQIYLVKALNSLSSMPIRRVLAGLGTEHWLGGLGYVKDVTEIYQNCSVYVQPTVTEGFGLTVLEAMAYGRPVIVTEGAGVYELLENGKDGFIVPIRDPKAIAERLKFLVNNPSEIKRMGKNARQKAEQYSWNKIRKRYEALYIESS